MRLGRKKQVNLGEMFSDGDHNVTCWLRTTFSPTRQLFFESHNVINQRNARPRPLRPCGSHKVGANLTTAMFSWELAAELLLKLPKEKERKQIIQRRIG